MNTKQTQTSFKKSKLYLILTVGLVFGVLLTLFVYIYFRFNIPKYIQVETIAGDVVMRNSQGEKKLEKFTRAEMQKSDVLIVRKDSVAGIVFGNGQIQTLTGPIEISFSDYKSQNNSVTYILTDLNSGQNFEHIQNFGFQETTAAVLGFAKTITFSGASIQGQVLGENDVKTKDESKVQTKAEKLKLVSDCVQQKSLASTQEYSKSLSECLKQHNLSSLKDLE